MNRADTALIVIDYQTRLMPAIDRAQEVCANAVRLIRGCQALGIPSLVTEQYSKGLGPLVPEICQALGEQYRPIEKLTFSAAGEPRFMGALQALGRKQVLLCGVEAHVCLFQTARDLHQAGYGVEVVSDAIGARRDGNYRLALERMARLGITLTSVEMALFDLMQRADIPEFKSVSALVK